MREVASLYSHPHRPIASCDGRWGWRGNIACLVMLSAMVPFMVTTPFTGFAGSALGRVEYSLFVGLPLAGLLY